jgi:hypothetical protein
MLAEFFYFFIISNLFGFYNTFGRTCNFISSLFNQFVINIYNVANSFFSFGPELLLASDAQDKNQLNLLLGVMESIAPKVAHTCNFL